MKNPVSFSSLTFNEALAGLLQAKGLPPKPKADKPKSNAKTENKKVK
jgi:hypothetical protein